MLRYFGVLPNKNNKGEFRQLSRIISKLDSYFNDTACEGIVILGFKYEHLKGNIIDDDKDWDGEIDMILILPRKIVVYEFKAKAIKIIKGITDNKNWLWYYIDNHQRHRDNLFLQASKGRAHFYRIYLPSINKRYNVPEPNDYLVDARVVLMDGSEYSRVFYKPPCEYKKEKLERNMLSKITNASDRVFVKWVYSGKSIKPDCFRRRRLSQDEYTRLCKIFKCYQVKVKTENWFKVISESDFIKDIINIPESDQFYLNIEDIFRIPGDLSIMEVSI